MEKDVFNTIKLFAISKCNEAFQYCGVADAEDKVIINSGGDKTVKITIELVDLE